MASTAVYSPGWPPPVWVSLMLTFSDGVPVATAKVTV